MVGFLGWMDGKMMSVALSTRERPNEICVYLAKKIRGAIHDQGDEKV